MATKASELQRQTRGSGQEILNHPVLNKGTAFTDPERRQLGLDGLLPPQVETLEKIGRAHV